MVFELCIGSPEESRTLHCAVRGRRLNRLTTGPNDLQLNYTRKCAMMQYEFITKESLYYNVGLR